MIYQQYISQQNSTREISGNKSNRKSEEYLNNEIAPFTIQKHVCSPINSRPYSGGILWRNVCGRCGSRVVGV
jgi:hypothetical protein